MIWLQLSWLILLLGAQLAFYVQNPDCLRPAQPPQPDAEAAPMTGEREAVDEHRAAAYDAADFDVGADRADFLEQIAQIARDRDFVDRMHDLAALDPEPRGAPRVVAGHDVHTLSEQLADDEALLAAFDQLFERAGRRAHEQIVDAAGIACCRHAQAARRIARQHVALQYARLTSSRRFVTTPSPSNGALPSARGINGSSVMSTKLDSTCFALRAGEKRRAPVLRRAANRGDEMAEQSSRNLRRIDHRHDTRRHRTSVEARTARRADSSPTLSGEARSSGRRLTVYQ